MPVLSAESAAASLAPTTLALASSLLSMSLTRAECKRHIALFSAATPLGALAAYGAFTYFGAKAEWTGLAILVSVRRVSTSSPLLP